MISPKLKVIRPSTPMYGNLKTKNIVNEAIFGEEVTKLDQKKDWFYSELSTDNYRGWIYSKDLGELPKENYKICCIRTFIKEKPDVKSNNIHYLPFQAKIFVDEVINDWAKVKLSKFHLHDFGYIYKKDIQKINTIEKDWVKAAKKLINVPYLWGGRDTKGLDCSGLLQLALQAGGILFPRDTSKQIICKKLYLIHKKDISRGSLVFWDGHVGIMLDKKNILHANAFHMNVTVEPLNEACTRMKNELYYNLTKVK